MIIVELMGGLGNQMFQYALGRSLAEINNTDLLLDVSSLMDRTPKENFTFRDYDLSIFNIREKIISTSELTDLINPSRNPLQVLISKFNNKYKKPYVLKESHFHFQKEVLSASKNIYLSGYWQSEKYFKNIADIIRDEFTLKEQPNQDFSQIIDQIQSVNAICLNVRRGDFANNPVMNKFHGVCDMDYYTKAIEFITSRVPEPVFFIFSDDIEWCQANFKINHPLFFVLHSYAGKKFGQYLYLMSLCKYFIIPNSTFGWWAAWLNINPNKIVVAPLKWFNDPSIDTNDLIPEQWIRL